MNQTELLDMRDRKWQHIGYKEQFKTLRQNLFKQLIQIELQVHIGMIEVMNFLHVNPIPVQMFEALLKSILLNSIRYHNQDLQLLSL